MHTIIVIGTGLVLLGICAYVGRLMGGPGALGTATLVFLPLWFIGAATNMYIGVKKAGYSVADEAPVFAIVFGVPAAVALFVWWKMR
jgi:hypothetical protein